MESIRAIKPNFIVFSSREFASAVNVDGKATKIILPFEVSRLVEVLSAYLGKGVKEPQVPEVDIEKLVKLIGEPEKILGKIPGYEELSSEVKKAIEEAKKKN